MSLLTIAGPDGHRNVEFTKDSPKEALAAFNRAIEGGAIGFIDQKPTLTFDPDAEHILVAHQLVGG